jgi:type IV pilus assembly protein PilB
MALNATSNADAIARVPRAVAFRHDALPLAVNDGVLAVALADPDDANVVDLLRATTRLRIQPLAMPRDTIRRRLHAAYGEAPSADAAADRGGAPAVREVDLVLARAVAAHASDVHVEPGPDGGRVRLRVDGILRDLQTIPAELFPSFCSRLKQPDHRL